MDLKQILTIVAVLAGGTAGVTYMTSPSGDAERLAAADAMLKNYETQLAEANKRAKAEAERAKANFKAFEEAMSQINNYEGELKKALDTAMAAEKKAAKLKAAKKVIHVPVTSPTVSDDLEQLLDELRSDGPGNGTAGRPDAAPSVVDIDNGGPAEPTVSPEASPTP